MSDHDLRDAARALRDEGSGAPVMGADATRMRILGTVRARRRRTVALVRTAAVLIAAAFGGVAWAAATGRLPSLATLLVRPSVTESAQVGSGEAPEWKSGSLGPSAESVPGVVASVPVRTAPSAESVSGVVASVPVRTAPSAESVPGGVASVPVRTAPSAESAPVASGSGRAKTADRPSRDSAPGAKSGSQDLPSSGAVKGDSATRGASEAPTASAQTEVADGADALYQRAHTLHFQGGNWSAARAAWDAYLSAAPGGRYATFAHYNRALCLLRLGQIAEARRVLSLFASGAFGGYRRAEAQSLLDALDASKGADR